MLLVNISTWQPENQWNFTMFKYRLTSANVVIKRPPQRPNTNTVFIPTVELPIIIIIIIPLELCSGQQIEQVCN